MKEYINKRVKEERGDINLNYKSQWVQMNLFTKQKQTHRLRKQTYGYQRVNVVERDKLGAWDLHTHTTIYKIDHQQGPTV